ncbi:Protein of unknown function [Bacillus cereus]|nr:Protein of unknown function [Bacillus cereus]
MRLRHDTVKSGLTNVLF